MGKPRLIILVRHAQSEANVDKNIHQHTADHKVKLTPDGHEQSRGAGRKLRALLRSDDTLHFFISPYRRTRETTEGILSTLCSDDPAPSPFRRSQIKVYEEPRIREQDFGNFQPNREEVDRIWKERAQYGNFFYRIPNGESGADCADRCSSFNDSLWRRFAEPDMASVAIIVSHGMVIRCFLMKWYHFSVEYFEDLRNINHVEFIVMRLKDNGRYQLQNQLRTWSDLKRERAARNSISAGSGDQQVSPQIPPRRTWACPEGCQDPNHGHALSNIKKPVRRNTADLFKDDTELLGTNPRPLTSSLLGRRRDFDVAEDAQWQPSPEPSTNSKPANEKMTLPASTASQSAAGKSESHQLYKYLGRDGGGSRSGVPSPEGASEEDEPYTDVPPSRKDPSDTAHFSNNEPLKPGSLGKALRGDFDFHAMTDALGDQSDAEVEEEDVKMGDKQRQKDEERFILQTEQRERARQNSSY